MDILAYGAALTMTSVGIILSVNSIEKNQIKTCANILSYTKNNDLFTTCMINEFPKEFR